MAADVTTKEIEDFRAGMMAERKVATVNHHLKFLKASTTARSAKGGSPLIRSRRCASSARTTLATDV